MTAIPSANPTPMKTPVTPANACCANKGKCCADRNTMLVKGLATFLCAIIFVLSIFKFVTQKDKKFLAGVVGSIVCVVAILFTCRKKTKTD